MLPKVQSKTSHRLNTSLRLWLEGMKKRVPVEVNRLHGSDILLNLPEALCVSAESDLSGENIAHRKEADEGKDLPLRLNDP